MTWDVRPVADRRASSCGRSGRSASTSARTGRASAAALLARAAAASACSRRGTATRSSAARARCSFRLSVPGGSVACCGTTVVGVTPTHRRRGVLSALMRGHLDDAHERGEPIAALWASEEGDLRPLRLRARLVRRRDRRSRASTLSSTRRSSRAGSCGSSSRTRRSTRFRRCTTRRAPAAAGHDRALARVVGGPHACRPGRPPLGRGPKRLRAARARRRSRRLRDLPAPLRVRGAARRRRVVRRGGGHRRRARRVRGRLALPARHRLDGHDHVLARPARPSALLPAAPAEAA